LRGLEPEAILRRAGDASPGWLAASLATILGGLLCLTLRSRTLLAPLAAIDLATVFRSHLFAFLGNALVPLRFGELVRMDYLARRGRLPRSTVLAVIGLERTLDGFWLLVLLASVSPLLAVDLTGSRSLLVFAVVVALGLAASWGLSRRTERFVAGGRAAAGVLGARWGGAVASRWEEFVRGFAAVVVPGRLWAVAAYTIGYWLLQVATVRLWIEAFGLAVPEPAAVVVLVFIVLGTAIPASPGYVGTFDYFAVRALDLFGVARESAVSFALVSHAMALLPVALLAIGFAVREAARPGRPGESEPGARE